MPRYSGALSVSTYTESSASGTTAAGYANAIGLDNRGVKNLKIVVKNTDGANSLYYKVTVKHADYTAGTDDIIVTETSIALGDEDVVALNEAYSRVTVAVKNNSGTSGYTVSYLQNR